LTSFGPAIPSAPVPFTMGTKSAIAAVIAGPAKAGPITAATVVDSEYVREVKSWWVSK